MKLKKLLKNVQTGSEICVMNADNGSVKFSGCANELYEIIKNKEFYNLEVSCIRASYSNSKDSVVLEIYIERDKLTNSKSIRKL